MKQQGPTHTHSLIHTYTNTGLCTEAAKPARHAYTHILIHTCTNIGPFYEAAGLYTHSLINPYTQIQVSVLKQQDLPDIWVAAGDGCSYLRKFRYLLKDLPSHGVLFNKDDRIDIEVPEVFDPLSYHLDTLSKPTTH